MSCLIRFAQEWWLIREIGLGVRFDLGQVDSPRWLQTDWMLAQFGEAREVATRRYMDFVRAGVGLSSIWAGLRNQVYVGDEEFVIHVQAQTEQLNVTEIPRAQRRPPARSLDQYQESAESVSKAMAAAFASGDYSMAEIARHFGVHYSTVSRAVRRSEAELNEAGDMCSCKT